ncbi:MAG: Sir2 family NAD-dependent protein deacetylase [Spirochaetota bacterium]
MKHEIEEKIQQAKNIFVFTGAGVSTASGLGTYRGKDGILESNYKNYKASEISHVRMLKSNPKLFWEFKLQTLIPGLFVKPNRAHIALVLLEKYCQRTQKGFSLVTQNVERLHQRAGSQNVTEVHGHVSQLTCTNLLSCRAVFNTKAYLAQQQEQVPLPLRCPKCDSVLRIPVVLFGEKYPSGMIELLKMKIKNHADLFLSAGTSYQLFSPITSFPRIFKSYREQGSLLDFNITKSHVSKSFADYFIEGPCDETLWDSFDFILQEFPLVPYIYELRSDTFAEGLQLAKILEIQKKTGVSNTEILTLLQDSFLLDSKSISILGDKMQENRSDINGIWNALALLVEKNKVKWQDLL